MKLHEWEPLSPIGGRNAGACRAAVPGGWIYTSFALDNSWPTRLLDVDHDAAKVFVPDPTAEHVTHGAVGAAAEAIYRDAVNDCCEVISKVAGAFGLTCDETRGLITTLRGIRFDGSTSQAGEG